MPYISPEDRKFIDDVLSATQQGLMDIEMIALTLQTVPSGKVGGAFNYFICRLAMLTFKPKGYTDMANMLSHLHEAEQELRRRVLAPYEDKAKENNGDLPEFEQLETWML